MLGIQIQLNITNVDDEDQLVTPPASKSKFELVPDFLQVRISKDNDDEIFKFGGLKQQWEKAKATMGERCHCISMETQ